jgi:hypothetical protein
MSPATATLPALHPDHLADLRKSGLTDETIAAARLHSARPGDLPRLCGRQIPDGTTGLVFEYDKTFSRVKLFPPLCDGDRREIKYLQPFGSPVRAYIPPSVREILADPTRSLCITEGEKKSLKLTQDGFPCLGLGGVWNFRTKDLSEDALIPDLEAVTWTGRIVYLVPDSDAWTSESVSLAVYRLARLLEARGATVLVMKLPTLAGQAKTGVDDLIVAKGPEAFRRLVEKAVTLGHPAFKPWREQEKVKARQSEKVSAPLPPELAGRRMHPALHFDSDGFAAVGILDGATWRTITSDRAEYPTEALDKILTPVPSPYPALGERWHSEARAAFLKGEAPAPSWAEAVATARALFRDYVEFDEDPPYAVCALWSLGTYLYPALPSFPRLNFHGEKGTGKSKTLKLIAALAHNGLFRMAPRAAPLFRLIEVLRPTLCLDELEHLDREDRGDIAAILNAGYQAGGAVDRCDPVTFNVRPFAVYAPVALAGIKGLNAVLADRCITLIMQPGRDRQRVNRDVDLSDPDPRIGVLRDLAYRLALARWREVRAAWERLDLPTWLNGRSRELWAPLLALADLVASEASRLDLRPALLALARPDAEERAELPEVAAAVLAALEEKLAGEDAVTIQPGKLTGDLKMVLGYDVIPTVIGLRLKGLGFKRDTQRKGGSFYTVRADDIQAIRERRRLAEEPTPADPPAR